MTLMRSEIHFSARQMFWTVGICLTLLLAQVTPAAAQRKARAQAKTLFQKAEVHFRLGEFPQALVMYKEAYRLAPLPALLFNIGQCHRHLGHCDKADFFYTQFLRARPRSPHGPKIKGLIKECKAGANRRPVRQPAPVKPSPVKPAPVKPAPVKPAPVTPTPTRPTDTASGGSRSTLLWAGVGVSAALLITGTVTGALAYGKSLEFNDPATPHHELQGLEDSGTALATTSVVTLALGGTAAAATLLVYLLYPKAPAATNVSLAPLPGGGAMLFTGRF